MLFLLNIYWYTCFECFVFLFFFLINILIHIFIYYLLPYSYLLIFLSKIQLILPFSRQCLILHIDK